MKVLPKNDQIWKGIIKSIIISYSELITHYSFLFGLSNIFFAVIIDLQQDKQIRDYELYFNK